jgi:hypothetical protein
MLVFVTSNEVDVIAERGRPVRIDAQHHVRHGHSPLLHLLTERAKAVRCPFNVEHPHSIVHAILIQHTKENWTDLPRHNGTSNLITACDASTKRTLVERELVEARVLDALSVVVRYVWDAGSFRSG